jgi:predicted NBD/HSP70 family sugar kinase
MSARRGEPTAFHVRKDLGVGSRVIDRRFNAAPLRVVGTLGRNENLLALLYELRHGSDLTCSDLALLTGLASPTVHRLLASLVERQLVIEDSTYRPTTGVGRPASSYHFNHSVVSVAGVDVGAETTRVAIAAANGTIIAQQSLPTAHVIRDLPTHIGSILDSLMSSTASQAGPLVGVGVGIPGSLDPSTGVVTRAFLHQELVGLPIKALFEDRLQCSVVVEKDDHLSVIAEVSDQGTVPDAKTLVVINYGRGVGVGVVTDDVVISGSHGQAGRIIHWPSTVPGSDLGDVLPLDALLATYRRNGGAHSPADGIVLCELVRNGDPVAKEVIERAGTELARVFLQLATVFDPEHMVFGGGFSGSFDLFERPLRDALGVLANPPHVHATAMGSSAVVVGGILAADQFIEGWLRTEVAG